MKIAIDLRSAEGNRTGKGQYAFHLCKSLLELDKVNEYTIYSKGKIYGFDNFSNVELKQISGAGIFWHHKVAKDIAKNNIELFWGPSSYITPIFIKKPTHVIITVHDLVAFLYPNNHNKKATILERLFLKRAVQRADHIITVSQNTKKDLISTFPHSQDKTSVVYCAANSLYRPIERGSLDTFMKKRDIPKNFFLAISTIQPRKNYINLIRALAEVYKKHHKIHLVIVGGEGWQYKEVYAEIVRYKLDEYVHILGYLPEKDIQNLYNLAQALVFPSFYEGFGIPALEAMQSACPVIASNTSSLPEVVGEAALSINPTKVSELAYAMIKVLQNPKLQTKLSAAGLSQAKKFTWKKSAEKLLTIIKSNL